ncbi:MAG TPA: glutathione synthetase [Gillisia sp.]|nr:glutathione synthetase [Gillisia sp.]
MKICFVINGLETEGPKTSVYLMTKAHKRGHEVFVASVGDFSFSSSAPLALHCVTIPKGADPKNAEEFLDALKSEDARKMRLSAKELDVIFLRNNPTEEDAGRKWAEQAGIAFGRMMQREDVLVLNDAFAMSHAFIDKLYFEELPEEIKPASIITRSLDEVMEFYEKHNRQIVLKPLEGSGGQDVYLIDENEKNINQITTALKQQGYIIAQEFLPAVKDGDVRVLLMNGQVLMEDGKHAVVRRKGSEGEFRSNLALGGSADYSEFTDAMKRIIELTSPKLIKDGLFLVGLDVVDDKLIEINVLSPGGLEVMESVGLPDFTNSIIESIEKKVEYKKMSDGQITNKELATMVF